MSNSQRLRIGIAIVAATAAYYYLLSIGVGLLTSFPRPSWWAAIFPSRLIGARVWLFSLHTIAVLILAAPAALVIRFLSPTHRIIIGFIAALLVVVVANLPMQLDLLAQSWAQHPVYLITDASKVLLAFPFLAWAFGVAPSNPSLERP